MMRNRLIKTCGIFACVASMLVSVIPTQAAEYWPKAVHIESPCAIVMEVNTGAILYEKNADEKHYPASITKIMTTMLALEHGELQDVVTFSADAVYKNEGDTSHIARDVNEEMTLEQCLYGVMLESANECAYAVAEHVAGTERKFVKMMNQKAKELGCTNTHFNNTNGLPDKKHYTSARDMALIAQAAYKDKRFRKITGTGRYVIPPTNKHDEETICQNHHNMLYPHTSVDYLYEWCTGGKTGYTDVARSTLVTYAEKDGMSLVCVIMYTESPNHFIDTKNLFEYCFDNFTIYNVKDNYDEFNEDKIQNAGALNENQAFAGLDEDGGIVLPKTASFQDAKATLNESKRSKTVAGRIEYTYANHNVGGADIVVTDTAPKEFPFDNLIEEGQDGTKRIHITGNVMMIILFLLLLLAAGVFAGKYFSDNFFILKHKFFGNMEKKDPRFVTIRDTRRKWRRNWKRKKRRKRRK